MATIRECRLSDTAHRDVDLLQYEAEIVKIIEATVPNKHPKVYQDHFTTDSLTRGESIRLGQALSKNKHLNAYGKTVQIFRLFDGKNIETNTESDTTIYE